jgi:hypothetical protein
MTPSPSHRHFADRLVGGHCQPGQQVGMDLGAKKPRLLQQQTDVVAGSAHHRMQRVAQGDLEQITGAPTRASSISDARFGKGQFLNLGGA